MCRVHLSVIGLVSVGSLCPIDQKLLLQHIGDDQDDQDDQGDGDDWDDRDDQDDQDDQDDHDDQDDQDEGTFVVKRDFEVF